MLTERWRRGGTSNKFQNRGGREDEKDARAEHQTHWLGASNEWMMESEQIPKQGGTGR